MTPEEFQQAIESIYEKIEKQTQLRPQNERTRIYRRERRTPYLLKKDIKDAAALAIEVAPQRYPAKHKQRCDTASYRGTLRSREQSVSDAGDGACSRSNQDQVQAKCQPLAEGKQFQGQEHGRANHCCDVKPAN